MGDDILRELGNLSRTVYSWNMALHELRADSAKKRRELLERIMRLEQRLANLESQQRTDDEKGE